MPKSHTEIACAGKVRHPSRRLAAEALNRQLRKAIKTKGHFPNEDAARKLIYLAITRAQTKWRRAYNWNSALAAFKIHFGDRIPDAI